MTSCARTVLRRRGSPGPSPRSNEYRAERAAAALHQQIRHTCVVVRDGRAGSVDVTGLVPGDLVNLSVVVWATGYRPDYSWISIPGVMADGRAVHRRGVTDVPGLYFLRLSWQYTRGSALLGFVADDAAYLAERITIGRGANRRSPVESGRG